MVAKSSASSSTLQSTSVLRRLEAAALIAANGLRIVGHRSQQRGPGSVALSEVRRFDPFLLCLPAFAQHPGVTREGREQRAVAGVEHPSRSSRAVSSSMSAAASASTRLWGASPCSATTSGFPSTVRTTAAPTMPKTSQAFASRPGSPSPVCIRLWASTARLLASARARIASGDRRAAWSTTDETATPTSRNTTMASAFSGSAIVSVPTVDEEVVQHEAAEDGGHDRRPQSADQGRHHDDGQH